MPGVRQGVKQGIIRAVCAAQRVPGVGQGVKQGIIRAECAALHRPVVARSGQGVMQDNIITAVDAGQAGG